MPQPTRDIPEDLERFVQEVRRHMRDFADLNELIDGEESGDRMILLELAQTLSDYNSIPPLITPAEFGTFPSRFLLLKGTVYNLLDSANLLLARNSLAYSDGGLSVSDVEERYRKYAEIATRGKEWWEARVTRFKIAANLAEAIGSGVPVGVHSEYFWISGAYGGYS